MALEGNAQIPKIPDRNFMARGVKQLGPCNIYIARYGDGPAPVAMTGTADATASTTVTGTGTSFLTEISPGEAIQFGTLAGQTFLVAAVNSDTELVLYQAVTIAADTMERVSLRNLGCTDATKLNFGLAKTDLMCSQEGAVRGDRVVTGYSCSVEFGLADGTPDDVAAITQGLFNLKNPDGSLKGSYFGFPLGEQDSTVSVALYLVRIFGGVESTDPNDTFTLLKAAPNVEAEMTYDAENQIFYQASYEGYIDANTKIDGLPLIYHMGSIV
jgi:hypothetical protein